MEQTSIVRVAHEVQLEDKYSQVGGTVYMSGVQALVRLPMLQVERDRAIGKNTAGFISGYRGSPLGTYDQALWQAEKHLRAKNIIFKPGVNEELAATAVWGTQQLGYTNPATQKYEGVFGLWYGKGPGVDRSIDVFKHANLAGTTAWGGVLAIAGDDHVAKSSTAPHQSDHVLKAAGLPVFFPANVQEILDFGLHAIALSRYAGVWASMKTIQEIVESSSTVNIDLSRVQIVIPTDFALPADGVHIRWPDTPLAQEERLFNTKWYAALAYIRANKLNQEIIRGAHDRLGLIASGKAYNETRQALHDLGLDDAACQRLGLRLYKVGVVWPLEVQGARRFAEGLREILVIEEKRQIIEYQLKEELYNWRADVRPNVLGKFNEPEGDYSGGEWSMPNPSGNTLLRANADLSSAQIARAIAERLKHMGVDSETEKHLNARLAHLDAKAQSMQSITVRAARPAWFCSGCPHNTSTKVPAGSRAMAGIGCHYMVLWMDRQTNGFTQMGGEGVPWVGQQDFSTEKHIFANLGDGTYFHSGLLAIRQAIASGVNITYKILYNDAVAMTGGQRVGERAEGHSVSQIIQSLVAEGVQKIAIVHDDQELPLPEWKALSTKVQFRPRADMDALQRELREIEGTTALIYVQTCATQKRRLRKRGTWKGKDTRVFIQPDVCEGCGDCGEQSNCLSIEALETPLGRKRRIDQSSCNMDLSCVQGFCPSLVSLEGQLRKTDRANKDEPPKIESAPLAQSPLPEPDIAPLQKVYGLVLAGVGGTGVITTGQIIGMTAHIEGKGVVTQDAAGLAQKGGATWSHVLIAPSQADILTTRVGVTDADLIIACDPIVAAQSETVLRIDPHKTRMALNTYTQAMAAFVHNPNWDNPGAACSAQLRKLIAPENLCELDAHQIAERALGDSTYANMVLLGYSWQRGMLPLALSSLQQAIKLNAVAVEKNLNAFHLGRRAALTVQTPQAAQQAPRQETKLTSAELTLEEVINHRRTLLVQYQNTAYAQRYTDLVERVRRAEAPLQSTTLTMAVAKGYYHVLALKDEYEVARLYTESDFVQQLRAQFATGAKVYFHLAPPLWPRKDARGKPRKIKCNARWVLPLFYVLAKCKGLRASVFDPFGYLTERRAERAVADRYQRAIEDGILSLGTQNVSVLTTLAENVLSWKGYGYIRSKSANVLQF